jgi:hypothetical protein
VNVNVRRNTSTGHTIGARDDGPLVHLVTMMMREVSV